MVFVPSGNCLGRLYAENKGGIGKTFVSDEQKMLHATNKKSTGAGALLVYESQTFTCSSLATIIVRSARFDLI